MKPLQTRHKLLFFSIGLALLIGFPLLGHALAWVNASYSIYWILLLPVLIIIFSPIGSKKLALVADEKPRYKPSAWILRVIAIELATLLIFFGICHLSGILLPTFTPPMHLFALSMHHTLLGAGLFPWATIAVLSIVMGYYSYSKRQHAYLSRLFYPLIRSTNNNRLGLMLNTSARTATMLALSSAVAFTALLIVSLFFSPAGFAALAGFTNANIIFFTILVIGTSSKLVKRPIYFLTVKHRLHPFTALLAIVLLLVALVIIFHLFLGDNFNTPLKTPYYLSLLLKQQWLANWHLFTILWWLACTPLLAIFIARTSRGYSWRATLIVTLALPVIVALGLLWPPFFHALNAMDNLPPELTVWLSAIGFVVFIVLIARKETFSSVMHTYLPQADIIKYRSPDRFISNLLQFATIMLCLYLATGILLLNVLFFVFLLLLSIAFIFLPLTLLLAFIRRTKNIS